MTYLFGDAVAGFEPSLAEPEGDPWLFAFRGDALVVPRGDVVQIPTSSELSAAGLLDAATILPLGRLDGRGCAVAALASEPSLPDAFRQTSVRRLFGALDERRLTVAALASQIASWDRTTRFCGSCGGALALKPGVRAKRCEPCERDTHPQIAPCVITLVADGDRVLLTRGPQFPKGMYGLVAGFVEPGESLERCVAREVLEETNITIDEPRYVASQPWPFPSQLMVGFFARRVSGEVRPDPGELEDAAFFDKNDLPMTPPSISIAGYMLERFVAGDFDGINGALPTRADRGAGT